MELNGTSVMKQKKKKKKKKKKKNKGGFMKTSPNSYVWDRQKQREIGGRKLMQ